MLLAATGIIAGSDSDEDGLDGEELDEDAMVPELKETKGMLQHWPDCQTAVGSCPATDPCEL